MRILGISAYYHDSAAAIVEDGVIIAAAQEERFSRKKHDSRFPIHAVKYCLAESGGEPDAVAFYDKPILKFGRILETYMSVAPRGFQSFVRAIPVWMKDKLWIHSDIEGRLQEAGCRRQAPIYYPEHHQSHAASAFYPSPFQDAAIITVDGVGEWATTTVGRGRGHTIALHREIRFPHSLGLLYSAFTYFTGFKVNSGEYKLMGLAPYGEPRYVDVIKDKLVSIHEDGSISLNMEYFGYLDGLTMTSGAFAGLFGGPPRAPESFITRREMDMARSIQDVAEEIMLKMARFARQETGARHLCLAGGVALNCVANGRILKAGIFDDIWIQPASGDAGGAVGAALYVWHMVQGQPREADGRTDRMNGAYLGPEFPDEQIQEYLEAKGYPARRLPAETRAAEIARLIAGQKVIGLLQGRMEYGPRALGNRSIVGDARSPHMQSIMNLKIKYRESFRPFAPTCLVEKVSEYFDLDVASPYMLLVAQVRPERCLRAEQERVDDLRVWVNRERSDIPAVTHVDYSARIQTVDRRVNPLYHDIIREFEALTGCATIINTSFNVRGEPIVCTPEDAYRCFMRTEMDHLLLGSFLLSKHDQPAFADNANWREDYGLD
jgi:carbamoyltransferase